jgi:hypothetical protein
MKRTSHINVILEDNVKIEIPKIAMPEGPKVVEGKIEEKKKGAKK